MPHDSPRETSPFQQVLIHRMRIVIEYHRALRYLDAIDELCKVEDDMHEDGVNVDEAVFSRDLCVAAYDLKPIFEDLKGKEADLIGLRRFSTVAKRIGNLLDACRQQTKTRQAAALVALEAAAEEDYRRRSLMLEAGFDVLEEEAEG